MAAKDPTAFDYDVALSFAGEERDYVRQVAEELKQRGVRVFYDEYEEVALWGKDLYEHLHDIYANTAHYCVIFISDSYAKKLWSNHERQSAQERALRENEEYILPARFDDTAVPGLRETIGYLDIRTLSPEQLADRIAQKVTGHFRSGYLPPIPDRLFEKLEIEEEEDQDEVVIIADHILDNLKRMSEEEREVLFQFFIHACPAELPENVHINIDLLRRVSRVAPTKIIRLLEGLRSLGIFVSLREDDETEGHIGKSEMLVLEWHDLSTATFGEATDIANAMILGATAGYCEEHAMEALRRLDFSQLAEATTVIDTHEEDGDASSS